MEFFNPAANIDFMRYRKISLTIATLLVLGSLFLIFGRGLQYGLDFTGGVLVEVSYEKSVETGEVRAALDAAGFEGAVVQSVGGTRDIVVRVQPERVATGDEAGTQANQIAGNVLKALQAERADVTVKRHNFVGPQVGKQLRNSGIIAAVFVMIGIGVYLAIRYERRFAIAALIAEVHDTVVTVGIIALFGREFDMTVLASVLAVIGYSVNDTVVVFDRVRELFRVSRKGDTYEILNRSVNNTLSRTIVTGITTAISMLALYIWGGPATKGFAVTMLAGILLGTLSSIFIANPLIYMMGVSKKDLAVMKRDDPELARRP